MDPIFQRILDATSDSVHEAASALSGGPYTAWGEGMNRIMAGGRSLINGSSYDDELQRVKEARAEQTPGAYSVIPQLRNKAIINSYGEAMGSGLNPSHLGEVPLMAGSTALDRALAGNRLAPGDLARLPKSVRETAAMREIGVKPTDPDLGGQLMQSTAQGRADLRSFTNAPHTQRLHDATDQKIVENALSVPDWHVGEDSSIPSAGQTKMDNLLSVPEIALNMETMRQSGYPAAGIRSTLEHELGERAGYHEAFPIAADEPGGQSVAPGQGNAVPFATHGTTAANLRQFQTLARDPRAYAFLEGVKGSNPDSAIEREMIRLMREYGGTQGRPLPVGGKAEAKIRERLVEKYQAGKQSPGDQRMIDPFARASDIVESRAPGANPPLDPRITEVTPTGARTKAIDDMIRQALGL